MESINVHIKLLKSDLKYLNRKIAIANKINDENLTIKFRKKRINN